MLSLLSSVAVPLALSLPFAVMAGILAVLAVIGVVVAIVVAKKNDTDGDLDYRVPIGAGLAIVGIPLGLFCWFCCFRVTIVEPDGSYHEEVGIFSARYDVGEGTTVNVSEPAIVNKSDDLYILEVVTYGEVDIADDELFNLVFPHDFTPVKNAVVNVGPDSQPPNQVSSKSSGTTRRWLRRPSNDEQRQLSAMAEEAFSEMSEGGETVDPASDAGESATDAAGGVGVPETSRDGFFDESE